MVFTFFVLLSLNLYYPEFILFSMKQNEASSFCFKMSGGGIDSLQFQPIRRQILTEPIKRLNFKSNRNKEMTDFLSETKKINHTDKFIGFSKDHKILLKMLNL